MVVGSVLSWGSRGIGMLSEGTEAARGVFSGGLRAGQKVGDFLNPKNISRSNSKLDRERAKLNKQMGWDQKKDFLGRSHRTNFGKAGANTAILVTGAAGAITGFLDKTVVDFGKGALGLYDKKPGSGKTQAQKQRERRGTWKPKPKPGSGKTQAQKQRERRGTWTLPVTKAAPAQPKLPAVMPTTAIVETVKPPVPSAPGMASQLPKLPMPGVPTNLSQAAAAGKSFATAHGGKILAGGALLAAAGGTAAAVAAKKKASSKKKRSTTRRRTSQKKRSTTKRKSTRKSTSRRGYTPPGRSTRRNKPGGAVKAKYRGRKVYIAKNGQPYILKANGQAQFVRK